MSSTPTRERLLVELTRHSAPELQTNIIDAGIVRACSVADGVAHMVLEAPEGRPVDLAALRARLTTALEGFDGLTGVRIALADRAQDAPPALDGPRRIPGVGKVVLVGSGKGGVGKSTVTASLALSMAARGLKVGILDADIYGPSQPTVLGTKGRPVSYDETLIPIAVHGLKLMSLGLMTAPDEALIWRGPILHDTLERLLFEVRWAPLDILFVDLPPGTGDVPLTLVQQAEVDGAVLVSTPQELSRIDLLRAMDLFRRMEVPLLGMVENMSIHICATCGAQDAIFGTGLEEFAAHEGVDLLGKLPLNSQICDAMDHGIPDEPSGKANAMLGLFDQVTASLLDRLELAER